MAFKNVTGNGLTVAFGTTTAYDTVNIEDVSYDGISTEDIDVSHLGSTGYRDYIPGDLKEGGTITVSIQHDDNNPTLPVHVTETVTITPPIPDTAHGTSGTAAFAGYINNVSWTYSNDDKVAGSYTIKVAGDVTFTDSST